MLDRSGCSFKSSMVCGCTYDKYVKKDRLNDDIYCDGDILIVWGMYI